MTRKPLQWPWKARLPLKAMSELMSARLLPVPGGGIRAE